MRRAAIRIVAIVLLAALSACQPPTPPLEQRIAGRWRATMEHGARASKDPLVRGAAKFFGAKPMHIPLEVTPTSIEVKRYSRKAGQQVVQRASYQVLDQERIALTTDQGRVVARVATECQKSGHCLMVTFSRDATGPEPTAAALEALGFLFGCDDVDGNVACKAGQQRSFFRYASAP